MGINSEVFCYQHITRSCDRVFLCLKKSVYQTPKQRNFSRLIGKGLFNVFNQIFNSFNSNRKTHHAGADAHL